MNDANLGKVSAALDSYRKSATMLQGLFERNPSDDSLRRDYLRVSDRLAAAYGHTGDVESGMRLVRKIQALAEQNLRARPSDPNAIYDVLLIGDTLAVLLNDQSKFTEAIPVRRRGLELAQRMAQLQPKGFETRRAIALAHKKLGAVYGVTQQFEACRDEYEQARAIDEQSLAARPNDSRTQLDLSFDYSDLGWVLGAAVRHAVLVRRDRDQDVAFR